MSHLIDGWCLFFLFAPATALAFIVPRQAFRTTDEQIVQPATSGLCNDGFRREVGVNLKLSVSENYRDCRTQPP